jgi:hypothetical protein
MTTKPIPEAPLAGITIRRLEDADLPAVQRLAELDSAHVPEGPLLGIEVEGRLLAATPLLGGETIADPFSRTGELRALLELRAEQIRARERRSAAFRRGRARASLPGAPSGASGRLATLPARST